MDPYRVLGLEAGASQAEIKRAYRRLAKSLHPDSAGERSLPAFLAVQDAYEQLVGSNGRSGGAGRGARSTGSASRPRGGGSGGGSGAGAGTGRSGWQEPWRADPDRARAAREQARARWGAGATGAAGPWSAGAAGGAASRGGGGMPPRGPGTGSSGPRSGSGEWATGPGPAGGGARGQSASSGTGTAGGGGAEGPASDGRSSRSRAGTSGEPGRGRRRATRKATLGSTSYDEARDASDPRWAGASWYGPTTGEYWIVNPREYADPRKHGPGYSTRGRTGGSGGPAIHANGPGSTEEPTPSQANAADESTSSTFEESAARTASRESSHEAHASVDDGMDPARVKRPTTGRPPSPAPATGPSATGPFAAGPSAAEAGASAFGSTPTSPATRGLGPWWRALVEPGPTDPTRRLGIALLAWAPIGLAVAGILNQVTGCATYALSCDGTDQLLPWIAQPAILGLLLLIPILARVLAAGTIGLLIGLVPGMAALIAFGGAHAAAAGALLALIAAIAWLIGVGWAIRVSLRGT